jgi:hypothetical protein
MQTHVKVLGGLFLFMAGVLLMMAFFAPLVMGFVSALIGQSGDPDAQTGQAIMGLVGMFGSVFFFVMALPYLICGWGLLKFKPWARIMGIIMCALSLIKIPIGTLIGIYGLWVLLTKETENLFAKPAGTP